MGDFGIKISSPGVNALSADEKDLVASSTHPVPQIKLGEAEPHFGYGEYTVPSSGSGTVEAFKIAHEYPYTPASLTLVAPERSGPETWSSAPTIWFFANSSIDAFCDSTHFIIEVNDINSEIYGKKLKFRYYIFAQNGT